MISMSSNPVPFFQAEWFAKMRAVLELLYFLAGVVIAVAAVWGLEQLRITRRIARRNAEREAVKFAAERCQYFADYAVPAGGKFFGEYNRLGLRFLDPAKFNVRQGEIVEYNFDLKRLAAQIPPIINLLANYLNTLEAFAIPFVARVADADVGFRETALAFCQGVKLMMPALFYMRQTQSARYESTIRLYELWNKRLQATSAAQAIKPMQELIRSADNERIRPMGTEDE